MIALADAPPVAGLYYYDAATVSAKPPISETMVDVCIYGGTSAGVAAALQLHRMGKTAVIVEPSGHLGGMSSGGLSDTDIGNKAAIGGIAHEFYTRVGAKYGETGAEWRFEPHVAEQVFGEMIAEAHTPVYLHQFLRSVKKQGTRLASLRCESGLTVRAGMFLDCSYEGDLMAKAGVSYAVGREANAVYGETVDGVQVNQTHQFNLPVDPYVTPGDLASGLLPGISPEPLGTIGAGDKRIQAYNFRLCLTQNPANRLPFPKPVGYDPTRYELLARYLAAGWPETEVFKKFDTIKGGKADKNNHGGFSTDLIGENYDYPEGDYATRERIFQAHVTYQQGLMWFMGNDPRVPDAIRARWNTWGLCRDEFTDTGGWPGQLYVREARRMVSDYVMNEHDCRGLRVATEPIGLAAYTMDSHNCRRIVVNGHVRNEGDVQVGGMPPYPVDYRALVPRASECTNLAVPVCLAASHIAYGSIRMEPVFMILGQSAATAAGLALDGKVGLQEVGYASLRERLMADGTVLGWPVRVGPLPRPLSLLRLGRGESWNYEPLPVSEVGRDFRLPSPSAKQGEGSGERATSRYNNPMPTLPILPFDPAPLRAQFPALAQTFINSNGSEHPAIFFDNPGGTQVPTRVIDAVSDYYRSRNANVGGAFPTSRRTDETVAGARQAMADLLHAPDPYTIIFGASMTALTFHLARSLGDTIRPGDEIVVTGLDHDANVSPWTDLAAQGATIRTVDINLADATLDWNSLTAAIRPGKTRLVAVTYASNAVGTVPDVARIVEIAHAAGAWVFVDAVQYAPHAPIDVARLDCDFLACSAYKFFGPHVGVLYGKREHLERLTPHKVRPSKTTIPHRWETGTLNHEGLAGVTAAVDYLAEIGDRFGGDLMPDLTIDGYAGRALTLKASMQAIQTYEATLAEHLIAGLQTLPGITLYGITDPARFAAERIPTVAFTLAGRSPREICETLAAYGICAWNGNYYALNLMERLGLEANGGAVRIGLAHYNTAGEIEELVGALGG